MAKKGKKYNVRNANKRQEYYFEDTECSACLYYKGKKGGCSLTACSCEDIKNDSMAKNRVRRKRGSTKWDM